ncbi:MAG TPA: radical SAM protein [Steroidobacteraceae bacterium]|jgi:uncharacterized protein|nr:radical SAM protein [Steroidobacteraceae bacterium]
MPHTSNAAIDFVVKISKLCNLRCSYCYEYNQLGERRRMSLHELRAFFTHVRESVRGYGRDRIHFVWHGGEPFLVPLEHYERIGELQQEIFGNDLGYENLVQTNLTVLTDKHIDFLREQRFFSRSIGVSFDVYGDQRIDTKGRLRTRTVLENMQRLMDAGVTFGAITVLARNTLGRIVEIYRFYDSLGVSVRLLPFYKSAFDGQVAQHSLDFREITESLKKVFDAWLVSERATIVYPLEDYLRYALAAVGGAAVAKHDPETDEQVFLVDTNGDTYGVADTYDREYHYGNAFTQRFDDVLHSAARKRAAQDGRERIARHCGSCPYFGYCPGRFAAEATPEQRKMLATSGCPVRELIGHIIRRIDRTLIAERVLAGRNAHRERPELIEA